MKCTYLQSRFYTTLELELVFEITTTSHHHYKWEKQAEQRWVGLVKSPKGYTYIFSLCHLPARHGEDDLIVVLGDPTLLTVLLYYQW